MTYREALDYGKRYLENRHIAEYELDAWLLMEHVTGITKALYFVRDREKMQPDEEEQYLDALEKRGKHIPLQHITGVQEFMGYRFFVNPYVLIPRQDTEILVEEADRLCRKREAEGKPVHFLDLCTGSGCILLSLLKMERQGTRTGVGSDISKEALCTAKKNRSALGISMERAKLLESNLFEQIDGAFQIIVSNPPYIRTKEIEKLETDVKVYDPFLALDGKEDGLYFYREITKHAGSYLDKGGYLLMEIGFDQGKEVAKLMRQAGFSDVYIKKDLAGLDRVVGGVYNRAREN